MAGMRRGRAWSRQAPTAKGRPALQAYAEGKSLTEAAHEAGFSDSAHFSRTFGLPATTPTRIAP
ncbi:MAG TPA: hypothetical protein VF727_11750 [Allosphingosinicella sp.]|jgi:methylphosphotriester-DNA--protein-cysteine methyltransferase